MLSPQCRAPPGCGRPQVTYRIHAVYANAGAVTATVCQVVFHRAAGRHVTKRSAQYTDANANVVSLFNAPTSRAIATLHDGPSRIAHNAATKVTIRNAELSCR